MKKPIVLKHPATCAGCDASMAVRDRGYWEKGRGVRCIECGPHAYEVVSIRNIPQEHDSTRSNPIGGRVRASGFVASQRKGRHRNR